ncbi:MAG: N-acetyl-gamma-glutamyl-phosphate reductase [Bacteroidales bacterium]|nr:N-acetyl-gamma-glutamyl-phosphate reductase [Bacteroidales bacterium]
MTFNGKIKVGIIGAAGYTAGELLRIMVNHPCAEILFAQSGSHAGEPVWSAHADLLGETDLCFTAVPDFTAVPGLVEGPDVLFLCAGHGKAKPFVKSLPESYKGAIIDLGNDFRLAADAEDFVYGLPEAFRSKIKGAKHIANPGCFATSIQLALLPVARADLLPEIHVTGITGSTGAGQAPSETTHFSWRSNNLSVYKAFTHQHLAEINETLHTLSPSYGGEINFVPVRGDFARGIMSSVYFDCDLDEGQAVDLYKNYYKDEPFVHVIDGNPDLKMVVNTNKCVLNVRKHGRKLHVISIIDNLVKGASGQAVQNMNLVFGLPEDTGLHLKGTRF